MKNKRKYFGTDGIRGRVGDGKINPQFMRQLGWAIGQVLGKDGKGRVLLGRDTRASGEMLQSALQAGLLTAGMDVGLLGIVPTPAVAYLTRAENAQAGIVISASHNPYQDNGIKIFSHEGKKLADDVEMAIEAQLAQPFVTIAAEKIKSAQTMNAAASRYVTFCQSCVTPSLALSTLKIVLDCANGASYQVAPAVFRQLGAEVILIGAEPDGTNINVNCGSTSLALLSQTVIAEKADLGIAFDGDADRVLFVDHLGEVVDGDELLYILASAGIRQGTLTGGVVGTLMSNLGLEIAIKKLGLDFVRANVGDRYVLAELNQHGWSLGGESSGHIINLQHTTTGDGITSALQVLQALETLGVSLAEAKAGMQKLPQILVNVPTKPINLEAKPIKTAVAQAEYDLAGKGRVLLRSSGTEPLVRVMVEAEDQTQAQTTLNGLVAAVKKLA